MLRRHVAAVHEKRKDFDCDECDKAFPTEEYLLKHQKAHHTDSYNARAKFKCYVCRMHYMSINGLQKHNLRVHKSTKHKCGSCDKTFEQYTTLKVHVSKSHGELENKSKEAVRQDSKKKAVSERSQVSLDKF